MRHGDLPYRTWAEEFRFKYGYQWPWEHLPCTGKLEPEDCSEPGPDEHYQEHYQVAAEMREIMGWKDNLHDEQTED